MALTSHTFRILDRQAFLFSPHAFSSTRSTPPLQSFRHVQPSRCPRRSFTNSLRRQEIPAPKEGSGPLLERRTDRALPDMKPNHIWLKTMPFFIVGIAICSLAIFNYQKSSSSVVASNLYALRINEQARQILGDEIYFASKFPWIRGEMNQLHGIIDINFWVKGNKGMGRNRFKSIRKTRLGGVSLLNIVKKDIYLRGLATV